jgi:murein peptide amidase A
LVTIIAALVGVNGYSDLEKRWKALRSRGDIAVREVACVGAPRTLLCVELGDHAKPVIALASGVHGDEPAAPWALLSLVENGELDPRYAYRIWPCTNPSGYAAGTRESADRVDINRSFGRGGQTPEARAIITANRDRKFVLSLDLHEDTDADGFYCYEYRSAHIARAVVSAVRHANFSIQDLEQCDLGAPFEAIQLEDGVVRPDSEEEIKAIGGLSYNLSLSRHAAAHALTLESPARFQWDDRIAIHRIAVKAAIAAL